MDENLKTEVAGIYVCGNINGRYLLQHAAAYGVKYLRDRLIKKLDWPIQEERIVNAVYSYTEVAAVGLTEEQVKEQGIPYEIARGLWELESIIRGSSLSCMPRITQSSAATLSAQRPQCFSIR